MMNKTLERAQDFASDVIGIRGTGVNDRHFFQPLKDAWNLDDY